VKGGRPVGERDDVRGTEVIGELVLELLDPWALRNELGAKRPDNRVYICVVDLLTSVRKERVGQASALTSAAISLSSSTVSHQSLTSLA
jgi:hypothetical protein